jgi:hypothetical protein
MRTEVPNGIFRGENVMKPGVGLALLLLLLLASRPARAYEVDVGHIMICDTQNQVERFAQLFESDMAKAISAINNEEHYANACALVDVAYVEGPQIGIARSALHTFGIIPIVVVAAQTPAGYRMVEPEVFFTPVRIKEYAL